MNFQQEAKRDVAFIISQTGLTQSEISVRAGYAEQSLTQMLSANNVSGRMLRNIRSEFKDVLNKSIPPIEEENYFKNKKDVFFPNADMKTNEPLVNEDQRSYYGLPNEKFYMDTITDLRAMGLKLTTTNEQTSTGNRILAENQKELIEVLKLLHKPTADAAKESQPNSSFLLQPYLDKIAVAGVEKRWWKSVDEGRVILGKLVIGDESAKQE